MSDIDYTQERARHRRDIRNDEWARHESDAAILTLGVLSMVCAVLLIVGVTWLAVTSV